MAKKPAKPRRRPAAAPSPGSALDSRPNIARPPAQAGLAPVPAPPRPAEDPAQGRNHGPEASPLDTRPTISPPPGVHVHGLTVCRFCNARCRVNGTERYTLPDGRIRIIRKVKCNGAARHTDTLYETRPAR